MESKNQKRYIKPLNNVQTILIIFFMMFVGIKGGTWVYRDTVLIIKSKNWISTQAVIDESYIETSSGRRGSTAYSPKVKYHFTVKKIAYTGNKLEIPSGRSSCQSCEINRLSAYLPGTIVEILYDENDPNLSVVERPEMNYFFTIGLGGLSILLLVGGVLLTVSKFLLSKNHK